MIELECWFWLRSKFDCVWVRIRTGVRLLSTPVLCEGMGTRLTWHYHNHNMTPFMNIKECLWMFMTVVIKCHSAHYVIFNAKLTLFGMSLLWQFDINQDNITCHEHAMAGLIIRLNHQTMKTLPHKLSSGNGDLYYKISQPKPSSHPINLLIYYVY